jgi:hypothetical protein
MQAVIEQNVVSTSVIQKPSDDRMNKIGFLGSLFGCWHPHLTRPISDNATTYQTCVKCGARRQVDAENFKAFGPFYYPANTQTGSIVSI